MNDSYKPLPFLSGGTAPTPNHFVLYPLQPGELAELVRPYAIDQVTPLAFAPGDTITINGKFFSQSSSQFQNITHYFFYKISDPTISYSSYGNGPIAEKIWDSPTQFRLVVPAGIPAGNYWFTLGRNFQSNGISVTIK